MKKFIGILKIFFNIVLKNTINTDILILSNDLTYVSLISVFPLLAIILGFTKGFGLDVYLLNKLNSVIPDSEKQLNLIIEITRNLLDSLSTNLLAGAGIIIVFWAVIALFQRIQSAFNRIYRTNQNSNLIKDYLVYISIVVLVPIIIILFIATNDKITEFAISKNYLNMYVLGLIKLVKFLLTVAFLAFMYQAIPNTKVSFKSSSISAFIVSLVLYILSKFYIVLIVSISRYNAIYGSLAFVPLFLFWIKYLWVIVLVGAQISYSIDNNFEVELKDISTRNKKIICILILNRIIINFIENKKPYCVKELSKILDINMEAIHICVNILEKLNYVILKEEYDRIKIILNKNPETITLNEFITNFEIENKDKKLIDTKIEDSILKILEPSDNKLVKDIYI